MDWTLAELLGDEPCEVCSVVCPNGPYGRGLLGLWPARRPRSGRAASPT
ncbi:hypothetical protein [Streptomyces olivochromogenes]